jgi:uncharacterized protein (TIGR00251 family)
MRVNLIIKPNSKHREEVVTNDDGSLTVYTKQPAVEGKANESVIKLVARHFSVSKSQVSIVRGQTSKRKTISIEN